MTRKYYRWSQIGHTLFYAYLGTFFTVAAEAVTVPHGLFINGGKNGVEQTALDQPDVTGMLIQSEWASLETSPGVFDWSVIDERVQQAADSGKLVRLALHAGGDGVPSWISDMLDVNGGSIISIEATKRDVTTIIPAFWDDDFLVHKNNFYREMAERYGSHPNVVALGVSMADPFTGDWAPVGIDPQSAADADYDSVDFAGKWRDLVRTVMVAAPEKIVTTAVGSMPQRILNLVNRGEDRFFVFEKAMELMAADPDIDMSRFAGGKGSLHAATPDPTDPSLQIPDDLKEWRTIYEIINDYGGIGFGQTVWNVTQDPDFKMNGGDPYGGAGQLTKGEVLLAAAQIGSNMGLSWLEPWEVDILSSDPGIQAALGKAAALFSATIPEPSSAVLFFVGLSTLCFRRTGHISRN